MLKIKTITFLIAALSVCGISQSACAYYADNESDYYSYDSGNNSNHDTGVYLEFNAGVPYVEVDNAGSSTSGFGVNPAIGFQFNKYFAIESGYTYYDIDDVTGHSVNVVTRLTWPVDDNFKLFAKLGVGFLHLESDTAVDDETLPYFGVGVGFNVAPDWDFTIQMNSEHESDASLGLLSAGFTYHF